MSNGLDASGQSVPYSGMFGNRMSYHGHNKGTRFIIIEEPSIKVLDMKKIREFTSESTVFKNINELQHINLFKN